MRHPENSLCPDHRQGFTLVELLVVVSIIAILASLLLPVLARARTNAKRINEMSSAKQLIVAWHLYADDHEEKVLPGYRYGYPASDTRGNAVAHPINARYPWRLAPYLAKNFDVIYANENRALLDRFRAQPDHAIGVYAASVFPSLGINSVFVGGDDLDLPPTRKAEQKFGSFCVIRRTDCRRPADVLVFLSARGKFEGRDVNGYYVVKPPYLDSRRWTTDWNSSGPAEDWGFVHPRFSGKAVASMIDGHVEMLGMPQLQDMRRWSDMADRTDWVLTSR